MAGRCRWAGALLAAAASWCLATAVLAAESNDATVIARVGNTEVKVSELRAYVQGLSAEAQKELADNPAALNRVVRSYVARTLVLDEAEAADWEKKPEVATQIARAREATIVASYLSAQTAPPKDYPSAAEIEKAYTANKARLLVPRQYQIAQIFVAVAPDADKAAQEEVLKKVSEIQKRLRQKGANFEAIARETSEEASSAERGGLLGWVSETAMVPDVRSAVSGLEKGGVSEPIKMADGWHLVRLLDTKPATVPPLASVQEVLASSLRAQKQAENEQAYLARLLEKTPPAVNELALQSLLPPPSTAKTN